VVELEIASEHDGALWGVQREGDRVGDAVRDADDLHLEVAERESFTRCDDTQVCP